MMREEVVGRRQWMTDTDFLDLAAATNFIPGPNSTELAIHIGHRMAGWRGLLVAGACFIVPAFVIVLAFAWTYVRYGALPQVGSVLYGIKPVIIAVVVVALWKLGRAALHTRVLVAVGIGSLIAVFAGVHELVVLFSAGALLLILRSTTRGALAVIEPFSMQLLFLFFLKVGAVLFGSGYVLLAFLRTDLVERLGWLSESQLLDAVAVGQFTPGPVFTTATFIGYLVGDMTGAVLATVGIFLPAFFFVAVTAPFLPKLRSSVAAGAFLDGLNAASFALMAAVSWHLGLAAIMDIPTVIIGVISLIILLTTRVQSTWLIVAGGSAGVLLRLF